MKQIKSICHIHFTTLGVAAPGVFVAQLLREVVLPSLRTDSPSFFSIIIIDLFDKFYSNQHNNTIQYITYITAYFRS